MELFKLILRNLSRNKKNLLLASLGLIIGISSFVYFVSLGEGVKSVVLEKIFVIRRVEVVPKSFDLGITKTSFAKIDERALEKFAMLDGVVKIYPKLKFTFPAWAVGGASILGGKSMRTEIIADGITTEIVWPDLDNPDEFKDWDAEYMCDGQGVGAEVGCPEAQRCINHFCTKRKCNPDASLKECPAPTYCAPDTRSCEMPIPVIVNPSLLQIYNTSLTTALSTSNTLPQLSEDAIIGFGFEMRLGQSFFGNSDKAEPIVRKARIVGFSDKAIPIGFTMPIEYVKRFNAMYAEDPTTFHSVILEAATNDLVADVVQGVKKLGYAVDEKQAYAERIALVISIVTLLFSLISLIIVTLSAINIAHTFFLIIAERRKEIGILRALGAGKRFIRFLILGEATILGMIGATLGILTALLAIRLTDFVSSDYLPDFAFKPESFFVVEPATLLTALLCGIVFCFIGAWLPASHAASLDPARAFSD